MKVHYFKGVYGRAEIIRMILTLNSQKFENVEYTFEEWSKLKHSGKFEFNQLPALELDGQILSQSSAILRYLAVKHNMYSSDPMTCWKIDSAFEATCDIANFYGQKIIWEKDETVKQAAMKTFFGENLKLWCEKIQKRFVDGKSRFLVGDKMTLADVQIASFVFTTFYNDGCALKEHF
jgi:glutathione S-transferase